MEHLVGRHSQPRGAQVHVMYLSYTKGWSQNAPLPRAHLSVGSGDKGFLLEVSARVGPLGGKLHFFPSSIHSCCIWNYLYLLQSGTLLLYWALYCNGKHSNNCTHLSTVFHFIIALQVWFSCDASMSSIRVDICQRFLVGGRYRKG